MIDLSIIFPVHNEAAGIERFIEEVYKVHKGKSFSYEVICVENGSMDESLSILQKLKKKYKSLRVIESPKGWGNAVRAGVKVARGKLTCYMVSDGQVEPRYIPVLYDLYQNKKASMVKVWRTNRENTTRLVNSRSYNLIARLLFGVPSRDINATPKIIETKLLQSIELQSHNIAIDLELLLKLKKRGHSWVEIPVPSKKRDTGESTTNLKAVWEMISYMVKFRIGLISV